MISTLETATTALLCILLRIGALTGTLTMAQSLSSDIKEIPKPNLIPELPFSVGFTHTDIHFHRYDDPNRFDINPEHQFLLEHSFDLQLVWAMSKFLDNYGLLYFGKASKRSAWRYRKRQILRILYFDGLTPVYVFRTVGLHDRQDVIQLFYPFDRGHIMAEDIKLMFFRNTFVILPGKTEIESDIPKDFRYRYFTSVANRSDPEFKTFLSSDQEIPDKYRTLLQDWNGTKYFLNQVSKTLGPRVLDFKAIDKLESINSTNLTDLLQVEFLGAHLQLLQTICQNLNATASNKRRGYRSFPDLDTIMEPFTTRYEPITEFPADIFKVKWESVFLQKQEEFFMLYCEPQLRLRTASMTYWRGPYSGLTWLGILGSFCLFAGLVREWSDNWEIMKGIGGVLRMLLRQDIPKWTSKFHVIIAFCCIVIHVIYEGEFTSQIAKPPPPILIKDLDKLLQSGYKFLITPSEMSHLGMSNPNYTKPQRIHYLWRYISNIRPEVIPEFQEVTNMTYIQPGFVDKIYSYFKFSTKDYCGESVPDCLAHDQYNFGLIVAGSAKTTAIDLYQATVPNKFCHFASRPFTTTTVGWKFHQGYHREIVEYLTIFRDNGLIKFWKEMKEWLKEFRMRNDIRSLYPEGKVEIGSGFKLAGNGKHVFIICGCLILISLAVFIFEVIFGKATFW